MRKNANQGDTKFYLIIAVVLAIITWFEFAFVEWQGLLFNNDGLILWTLYILSIIKFFLVVMFFMHLWGDHKLLTQLFTAGMVVGSITVAIMLMLFTANNMNRYRVEQPVSITKHGGGHGGSHGDEGHVEIPVRDFAETLARPAPKSQQHALAPREAVDAGSLNLPTISLPAIDQGVQPLEGVQPLGSTEVQPIEVADTATITETTTETTTAMVTTTEPVVQEVQVIETTAVTTQTIPAVTTTETVTTEVASGNDDLAALRAQVEALRLELESMEGTATANVGVSETTTIQTTTSAPMSTTQATVTETTTTQAAPAAAAATVAAATAAAVTNSASTTETSSTEIMSASATTSTEAVEAVSVSFDTELGSSTYSTCLACHQMNGEGVPGAFPPLKGHIAALYNAEGGRDYLIQVVLYGLQGEITANGVTYNGMMTPWNSLGDDAIAAVLNHELTSWGNDALLNNFMPITADEVATQRATPLTMQEVYANRVLQ